MKMRNFFVVCLSVIALSGFVTATVKTQNNKSISNADLAKIEKVVLVPIKIQVQESGVGSLEKLPERSEQATKVVMNQIREAFIANRNIEMVEYTPVDDQQQALLDDYVGLYQRVAGAAELIQYLGNAWKGRENISEYTLGSGLEFLRESTGTDKAIFVYGNDIVTSGGKKALAVLAMMGGIGVNPGGIAVLHVGLVDLNSGDLLWSNSSASQGMSLEKDKSVSKALNDILSDSPIAGK